jgi:hypothetical protein
MPFVRNSFLLTLFALGSHKCARFGPNPVEGEVYVRSLARMCMCVCVCVWEGGDVYAGQAASQTLTIERRGKYWLQALLDPLTLPVHLAGELAVPWSV